MKLFYKKVVLVLLLFSFLAGGVQASSLEDNLVPRETKTHEGQVELQYNKYSTSRYQLDLHIDRTRNPFNISGKISDGVHATRLDLVNAGWSLMVVIFYFVISVVGEAFKLDLVDSIIGEVTEAIKTIAGFDEGGFRNNGIWPSLIILVITIVGAWAAYVGLLKREQTRATSGLLSMILIFGFGLGFISQSDRILPLFNGWSKELQANVLNSSSNIISPGSNFNSNEGIAAIQNQMFDVMIYKPYLFLQYGTSQVDQARVDRMLQLEPGSEDRSREAEKEVEEYRNRMMSVDGLNSRTWFVGLLFFANLILAGQMLLMAAAILLYQVLFIALVLFAPVPLLMALVPAWRGSAFNWAMKTLHALLMKVGFALLMTVIFTISTLMYNAVSMVDYGYLFVLGMQILCYIGIWLKRKELFSFITTTTAYIASSTRGSLDSYREYRSRTREAMGSIPGASAAARFAKFSLMRSMIQGSMRRGMAPAAAGATAGGQATFGGRQNAERANYAHAEFVHRDMNRGRRRTQGPIIVDGDYTVMEDQKQLESNIKALPYRQSTSQRALAMRETAATRTGSIRKGRLQPYSRLSNRLPGDERRTLTAYREEDKQQQPVITLPSPAGTSPPSAGMRKPNEQQKRGRNELVRRGADPTAIVRNERNQDVQGATLPAAGRHRPNGQQKRSRSELVQRDQADHTAVVRNEHTRNTQVEHVTRNKGREANRTQQINQVDRQNVNVKDLVERIQTEVKSTRRQESTQRAHSENVHVNRNENTVSRRDKHETIRHEKRETEQTTRRVVDESVKRNLRNEWNRQQTLNLIERENWVKRQNEKREQQTSETIQTEEAPKRGWRPWRRRKGGR